MIARPLMCRIVPEPGPRTVGGQSLSTADRNLRAPASGTALEYVAVVQQAIEHCAYRGDIAEQLAPVFDGPVGSEQRAEAFVAASPARASSNRVRIGRMA